MKSIYSLYEGILGDIETRIASDNDVHEVIIDEIKQFLNDHYLAHRGSKFKISKRPNKNGMYEVTCNSHVTATQSKHKLKTITNGKFVFKEVKGWFDVTLCHDLESLEGCPEFVGDNFKCACCENLKSLKGCPIHVGGDFDCSGCHVLESLEGSPVTVKGAFICSACNSLKSLEGCPEHVGSFKMGLCREIETLKYAPKTVDHDFLCYKCRSLKSLKGCTNFIPGRFDCSRCESLHSIEYCPEYVGENFECYSCGKKFSKSDITNKCEVKGSIKY